MSSDKDHLEESTFTGKSPDGDKDENTEVEVKLVEEAKNAKGEKSEKDASLEKSQEMEGDTEISGPAVEEEPKETESERYLRLAADFDNYKKRTAREFGEIVKGANTRLLQELIEIKDNFERALKGESSQGDTNAYRKGVELIYSQLTALLERENVKSVEAVGQPFNPNLHEAMLQQESDQYQEGIVCKELQKGYQLNGKVLRHARVIVSSGKKKANDDQKVEK